MFKDMDPELKQRWVAALRSEGYKQAKNALRSREGEAFCCLGVLCDLLPSRRWEDIGCHLVLKNGERCFAVGLAPSEIANKDEQGILAKLNDNGASFEKIAALIEAE